MKTRLGFTLTEIMLGVAILGLLALVTVPSFQSSLARGKVRSTANLVSEVIVMAQSEALRRNIKIYVTAFSDDICIGTTADACDLRREPLITGVSITAPKLVLSPFYGVPSPANANFTVSYSGVTQVVNVNRLGVVTIGPLS